MNISDLEHCTRCGRCNDICPSYRIFHKESFSPRGRAKLISAFQKREISETASLRKRIFSCLLCGACIICPAEIYIPLAIYEMRANMSKALKLHLFKYFFLYPDIFFYGLKFLSPLFKLIDNYQIKKISSLSLSRDKNILRIYSKPMAKGRFALFFGCTANFFLPSLRKSLIFILNESGYEVLIPKQYCCGAPLFSAGFKNEAVALSEKNLKIYSSFSIDGVITPCPTCAYMLDEIYRCYLGEGVKVMSLSKILQTPSSYLTSKKAIFHTSCHTKNYVKDDSKIMELLINTGLDIQTDEGCCGFAGLFSLLFNKESMDILSKKILKYKDTNMLITSCPNCLIQFKFAMKKDKVFHYAEILNKALRKE